MRTQGVTQALCDQLVGPASVPMTFECGGGDVYADKSLNLTSPILGTTEAYALDKAPLAISMGGIVEQRQSPFLWIPGQLPFHVTDASKLKVICPLRYRVYADRVEERVPIFKEKVTLSSSNHAKHVTNYVNVSALPAVSDESGNPSGGAVEDAEHLCPPIEGDLDVHSLSYEATHSRT